MKYVAVVSVKIGYWAVSVQTQKPFIGTATQTPEQTMPSVGLHIAIVKIPEPKGLLAELEKIYRQ